MRRCYFCITVFYLIFTCLLIAQDKEINFSGEWILNADKSELGSGRGGRRGGMAALKMIVKHEKNKLSVESFRKNRDGEEVSSVANYTLDGEECTNEAFNRTSVSNAEWSEDEKSLIIFTEMTFSRGGQERTIESETSWFFEKDELILKTNRSTPRGEMKIKAVYTQEKK